MLEVGQVGGILRGTLCFFSAFPSGPGQSSGKCWFGEGRGPVSAKGAFHRLTILFFLIFILKMASFFGSCGLVFWLVWSRFFGVLASIKNSSFFQKNIGFYSFSGWRDVGLFFLGFDLILKWSRFLAWIQACVVNRALFIFVKKMQENICF